MLKTPSVTISRRSSARRRGERAPQVVDVGVLVDRLVAGRASRMPSMIEAWLRRSENTAVRSSQSASSRAAFAFQQETKVSAASVRRNAARSRSSSTWGSNLPQMKRTDAVPAP